MADYKLPEGCALMLRVCDAEGRSYGDFQWPGVGVEAVALDWNPEPECGGGLHGWLYGQGDHGVANIKPDSRWQVIEVRETDIVMLRGKCKVPRAVERFVGGKTEATNWLVAHEPRAAAVAVIGRAAAVGDGQAVTVGACGTATAGDDGTATADDGGTATAGDGGTATAGARGTATAGYRGTATAGDDGTATAGDRGTATAGARGEIRIRYWDHKAERYRTRVGYIGEDGLLPGVAYRLGSDARFAPAAQEVA